MIVYGHRTSSLHLPTFLRAAVRAIEALPAGPSHDDITSLLVETGEAASAAADALMPREDDDEPGLAAWSVATQQIAAALAASWSGDADAALPFLAAARAALASLIEAESNGALAGTVRAKTAEGFAYYGLYPEQYLEAADRFAREQAPGAVLCVGIRSIGWTLAHVAAAALNRRGIAADVVTVRPRGHPFERTLALTPRLARRIAAARVSHVLVVDEGPGISGSSFAAVCEALEAIGVPRERTVLAPSWSADPSALRSERGRRAWTSHAIVTAPFEDLRLETDRLSPGRTCGDLSAGAWRRMLFGPDHTRWPAVQPQHERRKYLVDVDGGRRLLTFAGLGRYGRARRARASVLADAGFGPAPAGLRHGFLEREWLEAMPLEPPLDRDDLTRVAAYLAFLASEFVRGDDDDHQEMVEMMRVNAREALGADAERRVDRLAASAPAPARRVAIDGRLLPHEWLRTRHGLVKVDALDHHDDDFFPGCRDIAWDVAGATVELARDDVAAGWLVDRYARTSGDGGIRRRLPFYEAAYVAWRAGYATLAAETLGRTPDGDRFRREAARYRRLLAARVGPDRPVRRC